MSNSPLSILRFKVIFIICWLVIITDQAIALNFFGLPWQAAIIDSLICNALLLLACLLIMHTLRYYLPRGQQYFFYLYLSFYPVADSFQMAAQIVTWPLSGLY